MTKRKKQDESEISPYVCNGHVGPLDETDMQARIQKIALHMDEIFNIAGIERDHNTEETPMRWAKMFMTDILGGRFMDEPPITTFENARDYDQMIVEGPIHFTSNCAHHIQPFIGKCYIGLLPGKEGKIIGLSKYVRIADLFAHRMTMQEDLTAQIADYFEEKLNPNGVGVQVIAEHHCMICRGVRRPGTKTLTTVLRGNFKEKISTRTEFLDACRALDK